MGSSSLNDESGANELSNLFESLTGVADNSFCFPSSEAPLVFDGASRRSSLPIVQGNTFPPSHLRAA